MYSHWNDEKPTNLSSTSNNRTLMLINDLISRYEQNSTRKEDDYIKVSLQMIMSLAANVESSEDALFIERMTEIFCHIIGIQRAVIESLEGETRPASSYVTAYVPTPKRGEGYTTEEQVKSAFIRHMEADNRSSFTINDYILKIQNLWRSFCSDYEAGILPAELTESVPMHAAKQENPLLNAYRYVDVLNLYVSMKMATNTRNRHWANVRSSLNKFGEAMCRNSYSRIKTEPKEAPAKDFSKYLFEGKRYGKSRLVLAVVTRFVEDNHPMSFDALESAFPANLQGSLGVVKLIDTVSEKYKGVGGVKRYFIADGEIIHLPSGEDVIVCTQWGANLVSFIDHVKEKYGYKIEKL